MANSANVVSVDFVSSFNMILIEYKSKTEVRKYHEEFVKQVHQPKTKNREELQFRDKKFSEVIVKLIEAVAKSINIKIEQLDISNKVYWPQGFIDTASTQRKLTDLLIDNQETWKALLNQIKKTDTKLVIETKHKTKKTSKIAR